MLSGHHNHPFITVLYHTSELITNSIGHFVHIIEEMMQNIYHGG